MKPQCQDLRVKLNLMREIKCQKLKSEVFIVSLPSTSVEQIKLNKLYGYNYMICCNTLHFFQH
jgi:hypothetical protein